MDMTEGLNEENIDWIFSMIDRRLSSYGADCDRIKECLYDTKVTIYNQVLV